MKTYVVLEQHYGDKQYWVGDKREMLEADAAHLIELGLIAEAESSEDDNNPEPEKKTGRKAKGNAPKNKADDVNPSETVIQPEDIVQPETVVQTEDIVQPEEVVQTEDIVQPEEVVQNELDGQSENGND